MKTEKTNIIFFCEDEQELTYAIIEPNDGPTEIAEALELLYDLDRMENYCWECMITTHQNSPYERPFWSNFVNEIAEADRLLHYSNTNGYVVGKVKTVVIEFPISIVSHFPPEPDEKLLDQDGDKWSKEYDEFSLRWRLSTDFNRHILAEEIYGLIHQL